MLLGALKIDKVKKEKQTEKVKIVCSTTENVTPRVLDQFQIISKIHENKL